MGEQGVRWGGHPVSHPLLLWLIEVPICNSISVAAPCQCVWGWGDGDIIGVTVRTGTSIGTWTTFVCMSNGQLAALWWSHLAEQQGVPCQLFTWNTGRRTEVGGQIVSSVLWTYIRLTCDCLKNFWSDFVEKQKTFSSYITSGQLMVKHLLQPRSYLTFLSYRLQRKHVCSWVTASDMPALISECDSANYILVHKQTHRAGHW